MGHIIEIEYSQLQPHKLEDSGALKIWGKMISKLEFFSQPQFLFLFFKNILFIYLRESERRSRGEREM